MKIAVVSETLPPGQTGQALVLSRLLQGWEPQDYCLISCYNWVDEGAEAQSPRRLPGKYYQLSPHFRFNRGHRYGLAKVNEAINIPLGILLRAREIVGILRKESCDAIVACTGDLLDLPAGYLAARRVGVPFYAYIFDHYSYREWEDPVRRYWAKRLEPLLLRRAEGVIAPNEILRDDLDERYGVAATVIHNSFDISEHEESTNDIPDRGDGEFQIVYTGAIYEAHYDAFKNLLAAIERLGRTDVKLHLYTGRAFEDLDRLGIHGPVVYHRFTPPTEIAAIQRQADLLFLPLAFNSPYPDLVRTSATTKLGEYLAAGTPVLVHAPRDSFVAWYFRTHRCGVVIDENDPARLAEGIERILDDAELRRRLSAAASQRARADFDIASAQAAFAQLLRAGK